MTGFGGEGGFVALHTAQDRAACFTEDNRLKVWDVVSGEMKQTCVCADHLAAKYTSIGWCGGEGKKQRGLVAIGTSVGGVMLWDLNKGELVKTLNSQAKDKAGCCVWDVAVSNDGKTVWSCTSDGLLYEWDVKSGELVKKWKGEKSEIRKICTVSQQGTKDKYLISARCRLKMWDLSTHEVVLKLSGHGNPLLDVQVTADGLHCVTCATGDRFINLWSLNVERPSEQALSVLVSDTFVRQLDIRVVVAGKGSSVSEKKKKKEGKAFEVSGVAVDGSKIALWSAPLSHHHHSPSSKRRNSSGGSDSPVKAKATITTPSRNVAPFLHAEFSRSDNRNLIALRGLRMKPAFDVVAVKNDSEFTSSDLEPLPTHLLTKKGEKKARKDDNVQKSEGSLVSGMSSALKKAEDPTQQRALLSAKEKGGRKKGDSEGASVDVPVTDTRSFLEKLEALERHVAQPSSSSSKQKEGPKKAESLKVAIEQALHSDDPVLLESCLEISSESTIRNTCQRLSAPYVVPFLMALIKRFEANPNRAGRLVPWIRGLLLFHGSYLMTQPDLEKSLGNFRDLIDQRLQTFSNLLKLSGRLEILISQLSMREKKDSGINFSRSVTYVEGENGLVQVESDEEDDEDDDDELDEEDDDEEDDEDDEDEEEEDGVIYMTPDEDGEEEAEFAYETPDEEDGEDSEDDSEEASDSDSD